MPPLNRRLLCHCVGECLPEFAPEFACPQRYFPSEYFGPVVVSDGCDTARVAQQPQGGGAEVIAAAIAEEG
jgi:hypothetical protein